MFCLSRRPTLLSARYVLRLSHPVVADGANPVAKHSQCQDYVHDESIPCPLLVLIFFLSLYVTYLEPCRPQRPHHQQQQRRVAFAVVLSA